MNFEDILNHHRNTYIKQLLSFYEGKSDGAKEILLKINSEEESLIFNLTRLDYLLKCDDEFKIEELFPESFSEHNPIKFQYEDLEIELNPIFWHGCEFILDFECTDIDWLNSWVYKVIDIDDKNVANEEGLQEVIHSVSYPIIENSRTKFTVDFGSATAKTFLSLIDCIKFTNTKNLIINSFILINEQ